MIFLSLTVPILYNRYLSLGAHEKFYLSDNYNNFAICGRKFFASKFFLYHSSSGLVVILLTF